MYSWPSNHTQTRGSTRKGNVKGKEKAVVSLDYPVLDTGLLGTATLFEENGRLEWSQVFKNSSRARLKTGNPTDVFPATRPPPWQMPKMRIPQRAEQGANFLRTFLPDIDVPSELIREQLTEDAEELRQFEEFDPYAGNQLETIVLSDTSSLAAFVAFPMGELSRDLNISPLLYSAGLGASFSPSAQPVQTFDTPIRQISAPKSTNVSGKAYLAVRTFGGTTLLRMQTTPQISVEKLAHITSAHTSDQQENLPHITSAHVGDQQVTDVKVSALQAQMTLIDVQGAVYRYDMATETTQIVQHALLPTSSDRFWRLELTENVNTCLVMSEADLVELDFRTQNSSSDVYSAIGNEVLTSIEDYPADQMLRLCSTEQLIWIDRRFTGRPLLSFKHGRSFDRSLEAKTLNFVNQHITTLSSRKNGLMTIYDVARLHGSMSCVQIAPYSLTTPSEGRIQPGQAFLRHPSAPPDSPFTFLRLSEVGSIRAFQLGITDDGVGETPVSWSREVKRLAAQAPHLREETSSLGRQEPPVVDLSPALEHFFRPQREMDDEQAAETLYDLVEKAHSFWQDVDPALDRVLTTYDVLLRSGDEPTTFARADFLTESVIKSARGYRALLQDRISAATLKEGAQWSLDLTDALGRFIPDLADCPDIRTLEERLRRHDLLSEDEGDRSASSLRRETQAREQLALDLTLSRDIFSSRSFLAPTATPTNYRELEAMTKTLSLEDEEPPPMVFGYLQPRFQSKRSASDEDNADKEKKDFIPPGVRLLLKDWQVGANSAEFVYHDPYEGEAEEPRPTPTIKAKAKREVAQSQVEVTEERPTQAPPRIVAASSRVEDALRRPFASQGPPVVPRSPGGSQPVMREAESQAVDSQDVLMPMASTQVLPGAYGGRPAMKKKVVKKRLGGF
ncbi:60S ribosomal protein [Favolaschia claudopus]|uniref:60S ribosomal protein n=1 Tax=Favolaschia claudopus TaxID=2862362 RepID=A0AAW0E7P7_9AGAR